ncbi:ComEC/Rec2 family competence protein [Helicobacter bilis]|uniref:ComEC/Rec2 family competence protein n=1 Tax=Helicobacter bilis TaxID=37372 RepID=UPI002943D0E3|nr:ComEC/Rec2 family competence protein [Helicobacter bilis]
MKSLQSLLQTISQTIQHKLRQIYFINTRQNKTNFFAIEIPLKHYIILIFILLVLCSYNLFTKYQTFLALKQGHVFEATILLHYTKKENSERFKLQDSQGNIFYATYKGKFKQIAGKKALVYGKIYKCSFLQFLRSCNIYNSSLSLLPSIDKKQFLRHFINAQHEDKLAANLYNALFFADHLEKPLRQGAIVFGLAHLIAISGFHLAILSFIFYALICPIYFIFHRYFCYRNAVYDLGLLGLIFVFFYLVLIDFQPSFLRAFIMACFAYMILLFGLQVTNFLNLFLCVLFGLAWNVSLLFHIGFLLSVAGVFCIFLFMRHFASMSANYKGLKKFVFGVVLFNCLIFLQMIPITHYFFPQFSPYQIISIPLSILFALIFPFVIIAHIFGFGDIFDSVILWVISHEFSLSMLYTPLWFLLFYLLLCLFAMRFLWAYAASLICASIFYVINLVLFFS